MKKNSKKNPVVGWFYAKNGEVKKVFAPVFDVKEVGSVDPFGKVTVYKKAS